MEAALPTRSKLVSLAALACWIPAAWLALFAALVVRAWIAGGEWPQRSTFSFQDGWDRGLDPGTFGIHYGILVTSWIPVIGCMLLMPALAAVLLRERVESAGDGAPRGLVAMTIASAALLLIWTVDPGGTWDWFLD